MVPPAPGRRLATCALAVALFASCSHGMRYDELRARAAPPRPGYSRIFVYTPSRSELLGVQLEVTLNGEVAGTSRPGTFFYVDREPGVYRATVPPRRVLSAFGNQGVSESARVVLPLAGVAFVRVQVVEVSGLIEARVKALDAAEAEPIIRELRYAADAVAAPP